MPDSNVVIALRRSDALRSNQAWDDFVLAASSTLRSLVGPETDVRVLAGVCSAIIVAGHLVPAANVTPDGSLDVVATECSALLHDGSLKPAIQVLAHPEPRLLGSRMSSIVPPFACIVRERATDAVLACVDTLGMRHLYYACSVDVALVSSSAALIASLLGRDLDVDAVGVFSQLGHFLGERSPFEGVTKLARGEVVRLTGGGCEVLDPGGELPQVVRRDGHYRDLGQAVDEGVGVLRRVVGQMLAAFPDAVLELSGGLDSRLVLASMPEAVGSARRTLTIGDPESDDMRVARRLVSIRGLDGEYVPFTLVEDWGRDELVGRVQRAALARDFSSNPMAGAIYDLVSERVPARAQFTGAAGEQARGRYYSGQRRADAPDPDRVAQVVRWQLALNQAVDRSLLVDEFRRHAAMQVREQAWKLMAGVDGAWPEATDQLYMFGRMQRWAGPAYSHGLLERAVVAPFFHPAYVEWASRLPVWMKRNAAALLGVLEVLDTGLFDEPLANGLTPRQQAATGLSGRLLQGRRDVRRLGKKIWQRLANRRHVPAGVGAFSAAVADTLRAGSPLALTSTGWIDQDGLERFLEGRSELDPVSLAFLVNLEGAVGLRVT